MVSMTFNQNKRLRPAKPGEVSNPNPLTREEILEGLAEGRGLGLRMPITDIEASWISEASNLGLIRDEFEFSGIYMVLGREIPETVRPGLIFRDKRCLN